LALANFPQMGTNHEELKKNLRSQAVGNYLIFYFALEDGVDIVRVIHGSRDIESLL
jgi:toxin ParE1/3/4